MALSRPVGSPAPRVNPQVRPGAGSIGPAKASRAARPRCLRGRSPMQQTRQTQIVLLRGIALLATLAVTWWATGFTTDGPILRSILIGYAAFFMASSLLASRHYRTTAVPLLLLLGDLIAIGAVGAWFHDDVRAPGRLPRRLLRRRARGRRRPKPHFRDPRDARRRHDDGPHRHALRHAQARGPRPPAARLAGHPARRRLHALREHHRLARGRDPTPSARRTPRPGHSREGGGGRRARHVRARTRFGVVPARGRRGGAPSSPLLLPGARTAPSRSRSKARSSDSGKRTAASPTTTSNAAGPCSRTRSPRSATAASSAASRHARRARGSCRRASTSTPSSRSRSAPPGACRACSSSPTRTAACSTRVRIGVVADVARRVGQAVQRIEHQGTEEHRRTSLLLRQMREGVMLLGNDGRVLLANPAARVALGCPGVDSGPARGDRRAHPPGARPDARRRLPSLPGPPPPRPGSPADAPLLHRGRHPRRRQADGHARHAGGRHRGGARPHPPAEVARR